MCVWALKRGRLGSSNNGREEGGKAKVSPKNQQEHTRTHTLSDTRAINPPNSIAPVFVKGKGFPLCHASFLQGSSHTLPFQ